MEIYYKETLWDDVWMIQQLWPLRSYKVEKLLLFKRHKINTIVLQVYQYKVMLFKVKKLLPERILFFD